jgi:3-deoxy-manno-octulosonate cytidylyltransferase (CMP-KDO synthetase)
MKAVAIIPARMAASRFPGKPLEKIMGLPMIEHVRRRIQLCDSLAEVIVATCDEDIRDVVESFGGTVIMTADSHERCTDRIAEAALKVDADIVINVQGDEPLVVPEMMEKLIQPFLGDPTIPCVNLVVEITDMAEFDSPNVIKAVLNPRGEAMYMSREPIPSKSKAGAAPYKIIKQTGLIAFGYEFLQVFTRLTPTPLEIVESIDMLRAMEHGYVVNTVEMDCITIGVDVPEDIQRAEALLANDPLVATYI